MNGQKLRRAFRDGKADRRIVVCTSEVRQSNWRSERVLAKNNWHIIKHPFHLCALLLIFSFINCKTYVNVDKPNQRQPFPSPNEKYILRVPVEIDPADQHQYWRVTITDIHGKILFKDDSAFVGNLNVYWYWDKDDRVWLNNSDDGSVYYWQLNSNGGWKRYEWRESNKDLPKPPAELFPPRYKK